MKFGLGFIAGVLASCLLCGAPSPSSSAARLFKWIAADPQTPPPTLWYRYGPNRQRVDLSHRFQELTHQDATAHARVRIRPEPTTYRFIPPLSIANPGTLTSGAEEKRFGWRLPTAAWTWWTAALRTPNGGETGPTGSRQRCEEFARHIHGTYS